MTDIALDRFNTLNNLQIGEVAESTTVNSVDNLNSNFGSVLDKKVETLTEKIDKISKTLGDVKNSFFDGDASNNLINFSEILKDTAGEINMENSLDLTLTRDISEFITQLQEITTGNTEEEISGLTNEKNEDESECKSENEIEVDNTLAAFEQLFALSSQNNLNSTPTTVSDNAETLTSTELKSNSILQADADTAEELLTMKDLSDSDELEKSNEGVIDEKVLDGLNIEIEDAETSSSNNESMMNHQSLEEHSVKIMLGADEFNINSTNSSSKIATNTAQTTPEKIMEQITKQMENLQNNSKLNMTLNPDNLGKVNLQITNTNEGLAAQFTVSSNEVRDILLKGIDGLKNTLLAQGVSVDNITVKVQESEESGYNPDWTEQDGSRGGNKQQEENSEKKNPDKELFETVMTEQIKPEENTIA